MKPRVLIVDDDIGHLSMLDTIIKGWGYVTEKAEDGSLAVSRIKEQPFDVVLMDIRMAEMSGLEALEMIKNYNPAIPILIMTAYSSVETAVTAIKSGAYDYLTKPLDFDLLKLTLERALDHTRLKSENMALKQRLPSQFDLSNIVGRSEAMRKTIEMIATVAPTEATVLITGESGAGKELIAKAIHYNSNRKNGPLVAVNCAALTETLLESELFGHEKGAFTGADRLRDGRFMQANKGTIFLDEIGEIAPRVQAKLLRVIQEREVQRLGSDKPINVDVRILAATNRNLSRLVEEREFREDLYYRLNVIAVKAPSLRERKDDIPVLVQFFLEKYMNKNRKILKGLTPQAMDLLLKYDWPGNVRELENAVERSVILVNGEYITEKELPLVITEANSSRRDDADEIQGLSGQKLEDLEKKAILATLEAAGGNKSETSRQLGITRATLHKKLKKYGLE